MSTFYNGREYFIKINNLILKEDRQHQILLKYGTYRFGNPVRGFSCSLLLFRDGVDSLYVNCNLLSGWAFSLGKHLSFFFLAFIYPL